jgi:hypothetical protein
LDEQAPDNPRDAASDEPSLDRGLGTEIASLFKKAGLDEPIAELRGYTINPEVLARPLRHPTVTRGTARDRHRPPSADD